MHVKLVWKTKGMVVGMVVLVLAVNPAIPHFPMGFLSVYWNLDKEKGRERGNGRGLYRLKEIATIYRWS
jgi:hypothetical protein